MTVPLKTRILLADDHTVVRDGLRMVLDSAPDLEVVAEASDGAEAVELALSEEVHLAVLDLSMPRMTGLQAAHELSRRQPELRVLILSMHDNEQYFFEALKAGASGYVLKTVANRDLIEACRAAMRGEPFIYPAAVRALVRDYLDRASRGEATPEDPLTPRELEVVKLIAEGLTSEEIAEQLFDQQQDRRPPPREHAREARHAQPRRADPLRDPPRARRALIVALLGGLPVVPVRRGRKLGSPEVHDRRVFLGSGSRGLQVSFAAVGERCPDPGSEDCDCSAQTQHRQHQDPHGLGQSE